MSNRNRTAPAASVAPATPAVSPTVPTPPVLAGSVLEVPKPAKVKKPKKSIRVPAPQVLLDAVEKAASEAPGKPTSAIWLRNFIAAHLNVTIPATATRTRTTYGSKDEKKAAQKVRRASKAALVKKLLAAFEAQELAAASAPTPPAA